MKYDLRSLKYIMFGGAPLGSALVNAFSNKLKSVGVDCCIFQGLFFSSYTSSRAFDVSDFDTSILL
jgi:hypothetical protein